MTDTETAVQDIMEMWDFIVAKVRGFFAWVYEWITVITATVTGALAFLPDMLNQVLAFFDATGIVDFTTLGISAVTAARISFGVAIAKAYFAWRGSRKAA